MTCVSVSSYRLKLSTCSAHEMTDSQFHLLTSSSNSTTTAAASQETTRQRFQSDHPSSSSVQSLPHMPSCGAQGKRAFLCSLVKLNPLAMRSSGRTNSVGSEFELGLQTGCLDCVMRDFAVSPGKCLKHTTTVFL
jgi:hypothetical protein